MHRLTIVSSLAVFLLAASGGASAQDAYTSRPMNVRAGPDREYPLVAQVGPGEPVDVHGCLDDWSWCDVSFDDSRGWVYAGGLSFVYQGERVPLYSYAPRLGLPIITFSLGAYWSQYYRGRPWYSQRDSWEHRRLPPHMRPPGRPGAGPEQMPHERTAPMSHRGRLPMSRESPPPIPNAREPDRGRAAPRAEERGRPAPPAGRMPEQHGHAPESRGQAPHPGGAPSGPPAGRGRSDHGNRGDRGNRPPSLEH